MAWGCILGLMVGSTKASTKMTRSMAMACIFGQTLGSTVGGGTRENNMGWASIILDRDKNPSLGCGKMGKELNGLIRRLLQKFKKTKLTLEKT